MSVFIVPVLQMRKPRLRQGDLLMQSHIASKRPSVNSHQVFLGSWAMLPILCLTVSWNPDHRQDLWGQLWKEGSQVTRQGMAQAIVMDREEREVFQKESPLYPSSLPPPPAMEVLSPLPGTGEFVVLGVRPVAAAPHSSLLTFISAVH